MKEYTKMDAVCDICGKRLDGYKRYVTHTNLTIRSNGFLIPKTLNWTTGLRTKYYRVGKWNETIDDVCEECISSFKDMYRKWLVDRRHTDSEKQ